MPTWAEANSRLELQERGGEYAIVQPVREPFDGIDWGRPLVDLAAAIEEGRPHRASAEQAAHVVEVLAAAAASLERGGPVDVSSDFARPEPMDWAGERAGARVPRTRAREPDRRPHGLQRGVRAARRRSSWSASSGARAPTGRAAPLGGRARRARAACRRQRRAGRGRAALGPLRGRRRPDAGGARQARRRPRRDRLVDRAARRPASRRARRSRSPSRSRSATPPASSCPCSSSRRPAAARRRSRPACRAGSWTSSPRSPAGATTRS